MGPETEKRAPSAKKFKSLAWRPLAALSVILSAAIVYDGGESSVNPPTFLAGNNHQIKPIEKYLSDLAIPQKPEKSLVGAFSLKELKEESENVSDKQSLVQVASEEAGPKETPQAPFSLLPASTPVTGEVKLSRITGYYCEQVPGYPVGDGGGYCGNTASGEPVRSGIAACGEKWPPGTRLLIEGWGEIECLDLGYLGYDQVDIFYPTNKDLAESGKPSWAKVTVIDE